MLIEYYANAGIIKVRLVKAAVIAEKARRGIYGGGVYGITA